MGEEVGTNGCNEIWSWVKDLISVGDSLPSNAGVFGVSPFTTGVCSVFPFNTGVSDAPLRSLHIIMVTIIKALLMPSAEKAMRLVFREHAEKEGVTTLSIELRKWSMHMKY